MELTGGAAAEIAGRMVSGDSDDVFNRSYDKDLSDAERGDTDGLCLSKPARGLVIRNSGDVVITMEEISD